MGADGRTARRRAAAVAMAATSVVATGCGVVLGTDEPSDEAGASDPPAAELRVAGMAFEPAEVTVAAGEVVAIVNDDDLAHTVTATSGVFDVAVETGDQARLTVDQPGSYPFRCELHPSMTGTLVVE